jgi:O-antigen/teichoic acid export membrane protein
MAACRLLLSYGVRSYGVDILGALALQVDQVLVISLLAPAAMGTYGVALSLSRMFNLFQGSAVSVLFPRASGCTADEILRMTEYATRVSTLVTGCAIVAAMIGPFMLRTLYGREYAGASFTLEILLLEVTISGAVFILAQAYMALGRPGMVTIIQSVGLSLSIPMMLVLIPVWGINGAAVALLTSTIARFLFVYFGFRFILKIPLPDLILRVFDIQIILRRLKPALKGATS